MKELTCTVENNGFNAFFFPGTIQPNKALICLGASGCNETTSIVIAKQFIKAGFSVLVLGFYMWKGMSKELRRIPVEYVENAVKWLKTEKQIEMIGVTGISTGAGYALLSASLIPDISAVMVASPYDYVMEACKPPKKHDRKMLHWNESVYTFRGEDIPFTPWYTVEPDLSELHRRENEDKSYGSARECRLLYDWNKPTEESRVPYEKMNADIYMCAAVDDDYWPSEYAVKRIKEKLENISYPHRIEARIFDKASHLLGISMACQSRLLKSVAPIGLEFFCPAEKKWPKECAKAREQSAAEMIQFFKDV